MKSIRLLFALFIHLSFLNAQQPSYFTIGKEQFEGVQIYGVIQDKAHNYWFATDQGFYMYDSHHFNKIDCDGMKGLSAFGFVINHTGTIFCHNLNHQIIKIENNQCSVFYELSEAERSSDMSLAISAENHLVVIGRFPLIFNENGKLLHAYKNYPGAYSFPFYTKRGHIIAQSWEKDSLLVIQKNSLSLKPILCENKNVRGPLSFFRISDQTFAIGNKDKMFFVFDEDTYQLTPLEEQPLKPTSEFLRYYNINNQVWIAGVATGVRKTEGRDCSKLSGQLFPDYFISNVYKDHEGNILLCTFNHGVLVVPDLNVNDVLTLPEKQSIVSVHNDPEIGMILGSLQGELIIRRDSTFAVLSKTGKKPLQSINSWQHFPYIIFDDGLVKVLHKASGKITTLFEGSLKDAAMPDTTTVYLALNSGVRKISNIGRSSFGNESIESLKIRTYAIEVEPSTKNVFVATADGLKIIKADGSVEQSVFEGTSIFANDLFSDGRILFVATKKNGVLLYNNGKALRQLQPKINGEDIELYQLIIAHGKIYANTSHGFVVLDMNGALVSRLNKMQGFATNKISDFEIIGDDIWIIHSRGLQKINTGQLNVVTEKPLLTISRVAVNNEPIETSSTKQEFSSRERKFRFTISSPTLRNKESIRYHYKLNGYEKNWLLAGYEANEIEYNALAPGKYTFMVKAENNGVYSETREFTFSILDPFYYRWWFITLEFLLFFLIVFAVYRWQLRNQRKKSEQQSELNASKLTAIQSQMNPHFIFNALNSIQDLILKGDVENSYSYITTFSNMVRKTLKYSERDFIDIGQELHLLELYLSLEKLRFKKALQYEIIVENTEDVMIPPLLIQPFVENSLVHGLLHKDGKKQLRITLSIGEMCLCTIEDNGIGREKAKLIKQRQRAEDESFSGRAIEKRFEILSKTLGGNFGFVYDDLQEQGEAVGTRVTLQIPVKRKF